MSAITDILGQLPLDDLANKLGASQKETKAASTQVITSLLGGLTSNASQAEGEQSLASALMKHLGPGQSFASDGVKLDDLDTDDGSKIVKHALGADTAKTAAAISGKTGTDQSLLQKLLPMLAPVVLGYVANQAAGKSDADKDSSGGVGSLIGGLLGGGSADGGNVVGSLIGGLLGGGTSSDSTSSSGGLSSILGGLLGGALDNDDKADKAKQSSGGVLGGLLDSIF